MNENVPFNNETNQSSAVSVYGNNSTLNDFPVLQAFQKYIDAEQVKSQKRLTFVCVFFSLLIVFIVAVFLVLLINVSNSKSSMNDTVMRYLIDLKTSAPAQTAPAVASNEVKILTDSISELRHQISVQQDKLLEQQLASIREKEKLLNARLTAESSVSAQSQQAITEMAKKNEKAQKELDSKLALLEKLNADLEQKKASLQKEKDALHQREVEFHRQRYAAENAATEKPAPVAKTQKHQTRKQQSQPAEDDYISYFDEVESPAPVQRPRAASQVVEEAQVLPKPGQDGYITYFNDEQNEAFYSDSKPKAPSRSKATTRANKSPSPSPAVKKPAVPVKATAPVKTTTQPVPEETNFSVSTSDDGVEWSIPL